MIGNIGQALTNIVCHTYNNWDVSDNQSDMKSVKSNIWRPGCYDITSLGKFVANKIGEANHSCVYGYGFANMTFGNYCYRMTFGNNNHGMTFGNGCNGMTFGNNNRYLTFGNNVHNGTVLDGVSNLEILGAENSSEAVQNFVILTGTSPSDNKKAVVPFEKGKSYTQMAGINSAGNLAVWIPADVA